jgi:hypothetical protein
LRRPAPRLERNTRADAGRCQRQVRARLEYGHASWSLRHRNTYAPGRSVHFDLAAAQRGEQIQLQRLGERLLDRPHGIEQSLPFSGVDTLQGAGFGFGERAAGDRQNISWPMLLHVDAHAQLRCGSRQRGVSAAVAQAFGRRIRETARHVQAQRPADRKFLTSPFSAQTLQPIALAVVELSRIKVPGGTRRGEP